MDRPTRTEAPRATGTRATGTRAVSTRVSASRARATDAVDRVRHHLVFQEEIAPVESYGVLPAAVLTGAAVVVAVVTLLTDAGAGTDLWFVRPSAVVAVVIGAIGTPVLARRRALIMAAARRGDRMRQRHS